MKSEPNTEAALAALIEGLADAIAEKVATKLARGAANDDSPRALRDCGQSVRVLRAAITAGELQGVKVGRGYQVRPSDLRAWLATQAVTPRRPAAPVLSAADRAIARAQRAGSLRAA